jgi:hypothetical protein
MAGPLVQLVAQVRTDCPPDADDPAMVVAIKCGNPIPIDWGSGTLTNGPTTVVPAGAAVQVLPADPTRKTAVIQNVGDTNIRVGAAGVTAADGLRLIANALVIFDEPYIVTQAIFAISEGPASSTTTTLLVD